jgi:hypothetical protein
MTRLPNKLMLEMATASMRISGCQGDGSARAPIVVSGIAVADRAVAPNAPIPPPKVDKREPERYR